MKKGLIYIILTAILFTTLEPVSKLISTEISPVRITFIRFFIGSLMLLPFSIAQIKKENIKINTKDIYTMSFLGILCICVSMILLQYAVLKAESPALIAIIFSSNSVFTIIFAAFILKDEITWAKLCAIALCLAGLLVSTDFKLSENMLSVVLAILAALAFSLYTVLSKKFMTKVSGIIQTGFSFFIGSLVLLIALLIGGTDIFGGITSSNIWELLYLGVAVTGIGYWSYFRAMDKASAMSASFVFFIKPALTPLATFVINGIVPDIKVFISLVLVITGSYMATVKTQPKNNLTKA
ncbi:MAG TPA: EamA family transporter [Clostridiales bacterium]|nr:EamA family transporter [Clostridiales bacterium]